MVLIEGLGNEVLQFGVSAIAILIVMAIWYSIKHRIEVARFFSSLRSTFNILDIFNFSSLIEAVTNYVTTSSVWRRIFRTPISAETEDNSQDLVQLAWTNYEADESERINFYIKHLDDTTQSVMTTRQETVINFIRRMFPNEMRQNCQIKLIYNGRILLHQETISGTGIRENCVMHCLIFPEKKTRQENVSSTNSTTTVTNNEQSSTDNNAATTTTTTTNNNNNNNGDGDDDTDEDDAGNNNVNHHYHHNNPNQHHRNDDLQGLLGPVEDWDLTELFCVLLVMSALTGWYCRFYYSFLFTEHSTFMLLFFTLVIFYTVYAINNEN